MDATVVRTATHEDVADIARIGSASMRTQYATLVDPLAVDAAISQSYSPVALTGCIDRCERIDDAEFLVAERAGAVVGFLHFDSDGPEPELHRLYVDPEMRGAGVGARLVVELAARLHGTSQYMLLVLKGNDRAIAFYERHGFRIESHVDGLTYYRERMGVDFPPNTQPFGLVLMRR